MDPQVQANFNQLKGMLGALLARSIGTSTPTVDFCCDMFDRADAAVLDGYWADTLGYWTLRDNKAIFQGPDSAMASFLSVSSSITGGATSRSDYNNLSINYYTNANYRSNLYGAKMSTSDFQVKVTFDMLAPTTSTVSSTSTASGFPWTTTTETDVGYGTTAGVAVGSATGNRVLAVTARGSIMRGYTLGGAFGSSGGDTLTIPALPGAVAPAAYLFGTFGMLSNPAFAGAVSTIQNILTLPASGTAPPSTQVYTSTPGGTFIGSQSVVATGQTYPLNVAGRPLLVAGTNTLLVQMTGNVYNIYLNGTLWQTVTQAVMTDRSQPGLSTFSTNMLAFIQGLGIANYGITGFKAWPMNAAEPLNQTGHGTYAGGYVDRFHANGTYNPLATA